MATKEDRRVFVDTNVFLAATDTNRDVHADAKRFLKDAVTGCWRAFATPQIFREYWVVATRPVEDNGLGLSPADALHNTDAFRQLIQLLPEDRKTHDILTKLVRRHGLKGKRIHDANLIAVMEANGLRQIKTYNSGDFSPFEVEILDSELSH